MKAFYIDKEGYTIGIHVSTWKEESMWYHRVLSIFYPSIKKRFFRLEPMEVESKETSPGVYDLTIPNQPKGTEIIIEKQ